MTLPGFESVPGNSAGSFIGLPWRVVLHTTEGATAEGAIGAYQTSNSWPHFTVDLIRRRRIQHIDLSLAARALLHPPTTETNRANAIQIELVGFAIQTPSWAKTDIEWLSTNVLAPIRAVTPFALTAARFVSYPSSAGFGAAQRFTVVEWQGFSGICGHEHVPGNDHGDPGLIDTTTILNALGPTPPTPTPPPEETKVLALIRAPSGWIGSTDGLHKHHLVSGDAIREYLFSARAAGLTVKADVGDAPFNWPQDLVDSIPDA